MRYTAIRFTGDGFAVQDREESLTLEILNEIDARSDVTQRHLATRLGVALGLANSYLKRCVRKGLVKITQAPANRYMYYLTPSGFAEKSRLTAQYLTHSMDFYRRASAQMAVVLGHCEQNGWERVLLGGMSELAEVASVRAHDFRVSIVGTFEPTAGVDAFLGHPVWRSLQDADPADACVYTALANSRAVYPELTCRFGQERVVVPEILQSILYVEKSAGPIA